MFGRLIAATVVFALNASAASAQSPSLVGLPQGSDPTCNSGEYYLAVLTSGAKWRKCENGVWSDIGATAGSGEANTASNLGGGLANYASKSGVDLRFNSFNSSHFDLASNLISADEAGLESLLDLADLAGLLPLSKITDDASSGKCLLSGGGGGDPAWGTCAGSISPLTADLDFANYDGQNLGDIAFEGRNTHAPAVDVTTATSPTHVKAIDEKLWFNIDGQKQPVEGEGGGIAKTKTVGREINVVNLSESEAYGQWTTLIAGGDSDTVANMTNVYCTGGAHASGDEGCQGIRSFLVDYYLTATGTVSAGLTSGAGTQTVAVGGITEAESSVLGENKLAVFSGSSVTVTISDAPPGTFNNGVLEDPGTTWSFDGSATGQGVWTLGSGQVTSSGVQSTGWCFAAVDSDYNDINGNAARIWLKISAINSGSDTVTTRWENQGYNGKTPYPYLAGEGASEGVVAPCAEMDSPTFAGGVGDFVADSLSFRKGSGFPAISSGATFEVNAYPDIRNVSMRAIAATKLGGMYDHAGVRATNLLDGSNLSGRFQLHDAFAASFSGATTNLKDGTYNAWKRGLECSEHDTTGSSCEIGVDYYYAPDPSDLNPQQWFAEIEWSSEDWADDIDRVLLRINNASGSNLTLDKTDGYGMNGDPFARLESAQTISGQKTVTSKFDFGGGTLEVPNSTTLPATCVVGESYMDTDATTGQRFYLCESVNNWVLQSGGGGGGGGGDNITVEDSDNAGTFSSANDAAFEDSGDINFVLDTVPTPDQISAQIRADAVGAPEIAAGAVGTSEAAALDTGDITTGQFADARVDGSLESDEITGLADSQVSDTLTASIFKGSGTTTNAVDLATAEVSGTLAQANGGTGTTSLPAYTVGVTAPVDGTTACTNGDMYLDRAAQKVYWCVDSATDDWWGVALADTP